MDNFQIETAQNVQIAQNIAGLGDRILAFLLDWLILIIYEILAFIVLLQSNVFDMGALWAVYLVFGLPPFLYFLFMEALNNGQTIGKAALKIRVVKLDGTPARFSNHIIRWALRIVDFSITSGACAVFTFLLNDKGQRLGDIAAKTTVISEKEHIGLKDTLLEEIPVAYEPTYPQVTMFSDKDMQTIKSLYTRSKNKNKQEVITSLAKKIAGIMDIRYDESPAEFVNQVLTDYNYYTQQ